MPAPSAFTKVDTLLTPLVREVAGWLSADIRAQQLTDSLTVLLAREIARRQLHRGESHLKSLSELALTPNETASGEAQAILFPWYQVPEAFALQTYQHQFLLRASLLVDDLVSQPLRPAELLGLVFERIIALSDCTFGTHRQRDLGLHITPQSLASRAVFKALENLDETDLEIDGPFHVLDPCLGGGAFWIGCIDWARKTLSLTDDTARTWPLGRLYGIDVCETAAEIAILALRTELQADLEFHLRMREQFIHGDSLQVEVPPSWPLDWRLIVANPPWHHIESNSVSPKPTDLKKSQKTSRLNLVDLFVERILSLRSADTRYAFILPSKLLEQESYRTTRKRLLDQEDLRAAIDLGQRNFQAVTEGAALIVGGPLNQSPEWVEISPSRNGQLQQEACQLSRQAIASNPKLSFRPPLKQLEAHHGFCRLSELATISDSGIDYTNAEMGREILYTSQTAKSPNDRRTLRGRDIHSYMIKESDRWLRGDWKQRRDALRKRLPRAKAKVNDRIYNLRPKLLLRQTSAELIAAIDWNYSAHQRSLLAVSASQPRTLQILVFILNHPWTTEVLQDLSYQGGRDFAQIKVSVLRELPVPKWSKEEEADLYEELHQDLDEPLRLDANSRRCAEEWVEGLYRRRGFRPRASGEAS